LPLCAPPWVPDIQAEFNRVAQALADYAGGTVVVMADVAGMGRFANAESGLDAVFLLLDSESLHQFRFWLADLLEWNIGIDLARRWGYVPHVTLGYVPTDSEVQLAPTAPRTLVFDQLALSWGEQTIVFPLRGEMREQTAGAVAVNCNCPEDNMEQEKKQAQATKVQTKGTKANDEAAAVQPEQPAQEETLAAVVPPEVELPGELTELLQAVRELGGVGALMDAVRGVKANSDRQKGGMVARLAANSRCAFTKAELETMSVDQLGKLEASMLPRSYVGQGGAELSTGGDELRVFKGAETKKEATA
jgi:hypothetical protein